MVPTPLRCCRTMWRIGMWAKLQGGYYCGLDRFEEHLSGKRITDINATLIGDIVKARRADVVTSATIKADLVALSAVLNARGKARSKPSLAAIIRRAEACAKTALPSAPSAQSSSSTLGGISATSGSAWAIPPSR
jgi:hypothetical protein